MFATSFNLAVGEQLNTRVLLFPVTAGLHGPLVFALPVRLVCFAAPEHIRNAAMQAGKISSRYLIARCRRILLVFFGTAIANTRRFDTEVLICID
jgi:hypothetical protein